MLINYGSLAPASVTRVSLADALGLGDDEARELFEGKIVLVAATYAGGVDVGPTPLDPRTPSSFAHIYTLHTMLTGEQLRPSPAGAPFVFAVLIVGLLSTQVPARHPARLMAMAAALVAIFTAGTGALFLGGGLVLKPGLPVLATAVFVSGYGLQQWWTTNSHLRRRNRELLETLANLRRTTSSKERMEAELNIARSIQFSMVPLEFPPFPDREEFALHATLVPAREVGGDFYDFFLIDDDHLFFCVADVSGKGVPAALFMAVSKTLLKSNAAKTISPASIVSRTNDELARDNDESMFVTVWLGILTLTTGELRYTNAGHNPPYVRTREGELVRLDQRHGPVVAAVEGMRYGEGTAMLAAGDTVLLYTDGVSEAMDPAGRLFEEKGLTRLILAASPVSVEEIVNVTTEGVWECQDSAPQADDVTVLALQYYGAVSTAASNPTLHEADG